MRVATWNLAGRWSEAHLALLTRLDADVLLLTEVSDALELPDYSVHRTEATMAPGQTWAAVATRTPLNPLPEPHPATAAVMSEGWTLVSTVLPWRSCGTDPWGGGLHADKATRALDQLVPHLTDRRLIWGGDWDHALVGREYAGSLAGRRYLLSALEDLLLTTPTAELPHRVRGLSTIDHIAISLLPADSRACRVEASAEGRYLSDHDAYVVEFS